MFDFSRCMSIIIRFSMKPTYNPSKIRRARKFGFRSTQSTAAGRKVLKNRRRKGRAKLSASVATKFSLRTKKFFEIMRQNFSSSRKICKSFEFERIKKKESKNSGKHFFCKITCCNNSKPICQSLE